MEPTCHRWIPRTEGQWWGICVHIMMFLWLCHDDVIKWKPFPRYWSFVWGIHSSPVNSPHKVPVTRSFGVSLNWPDQIVKWTVELMVIWDAMAPIVTSLLCEVNGQSFPSDTLCVITLLQSPKTTKNSHPELGPWVQNRLPFRDLHDPVLYFMWCWVVLYRVITIFDGHIMNLMKHPVLWSYVYGHS